EAREREQQPLGGERPGGAFGAGPADGADVDMLATDAAGQVFVSRMGLVDSRAGDAYGADEDEDLDDDDDDDVDTHGRLMYPTNEDDDEDYGAHSSLYFSRKPADAAFGLPPSLTDDEDQFIIRDIDDDDDDDDEDDEDYCTAANAEDIGPAGRMGRFRSYQNEPTPAASSDEEDSPGPSGETPGSREQTPEEPREQTPGDNSDDQGNEGSTSACSDCVVVDDGAPLPAKEDVDVDVDIEPKEDARQARRQLVRLSLDGSTHTVAPAEQPGSDDVASPALPAYLLALPSIPSPTTDSEALDSAPPPMPPRPSDADCASFKDSMARMAAQNPALKLPALVAGQPEPKGRLQDLLYRESKQRSLSSSELDNIVPSDIGSWGAPGGSGSNSSSGQGSNGNSVGGQGRRGVAAADPSSLEAGADEGAGSEQAGTFAARRRRSRSQSAGVGISRAMVIQAAVQGQFPYLDAKTCQFVGQLKSDTVTLGGAAASGSARPRSKPIPPLPSSSSPTMNPASDDVPPVPLRPPTLPPSSLRLRSSAIASDSDDDDDEEPAGAAKAPSSAFPPIPLLPPVSSAVSHAGLPTPAHSGGGSRAKPAQHHHSNNMQKSEMSSSLTYAAVAMSASNGVSALPTPSIITTELPSYTSPAAAPKPAPLASTSTSMLWAAVAANGRSGGGGNTGGGSTSGGGRNRGQRSTSRGFGGPRVPEFPMLPMSPVGKESPQLFSGKK
ncbi:hypothetical protein IWW50_001693, partial [Coemansia erecta]